MEKTAKGKGDFVENNLTEEINRKKECPYAY